MLNRNAIRSYMEIEGVLYPIGDGFTRFAFSMRPIEYTRTYLDECAPRTDAVGYEDRILYAFEAIEGDRVSSHMLSLLRSLHGKSRVCVDIVTVLGKAGQVCRAKRQRYTLCPDTVGDGCDALTAKGSLRACGVAEYGTLDEAHLTFTADI